MRVLLIDVNCKNSSTGKIVYDLYSGINEVGDEAAICYGRGSLVEGKNIYKFGLDWETRIHAGLARITGLNGYFSYFSTRRLLKFIDEFQPDVIHIHELHAYFVNIFPLIEHIKKMKIKVVWTFHCEYMYTGKCGHAYGCDKFESECGKCPFIRNYPKSLLFDKTKKMFLDKKRALENLDFTIVTPSKWLADRVEKSFLKGKSIIVIHNGINTKKVFYPRSDKEIEKMRQKYDLLGKKIVLSVAPSIMSESKGGQTVIQVSQQMKMQDVYFVLVGADETRKYNDNVLLISRTQNQDELAVWYSMADVFLICSKKENFPTTCLEAFSCGTPVVGIDGGGTKETVPAPMGVFVSERKLLPEAIKKQLQTKWDREEIRKLAVEKYSQRVMYEKYIELYRQCDK